MAVETVQSCRLAHKGCAPLSLSCKRVKRAGPGRPAMPPRCPEAPGYAPSPWTRRRWMQLAFGWWSSRPGAPYCHGNVWMPVRTCARGHAPGELPPLCDDGPHAVVRRIAAVVRRYDAPPRRKPRAVPLRAAKRGAR